MIVRHVYPWKDYAAARAEFDTLSARDDLEFCEISTGKDADGARVWLVRHEAAAPAVATLTHDGKTLVVTLPCGAVAKRQTNNRYAAAIVGFDAAGKLRILSAHWTRDAALSTLATWKAGKWVNQNFRALVGAPTIVG